VSLLLYAASGVLRNRRRTFSSILGVLLAITFIAGTFIAIDSSTRFALDRMLADVPGDFGLFAYPTSGGNGSDLRDSLAAVSGVTDVSVYRTLSVNEIRGPGNSTASYFQVFAVDPDHVPVSMRPTKLQGSSALAQGDVALSSELAGQLGASLGDRVEFRNVQYTYFGNTTTWTLNLTVAGIVTLPPPPSSPYGMVYYPGTAPGMGFVNLRDADWVLAQLNLTDSMRAIQGEIWIYRPRFINPYDQQATTFALTRLGRQLEETLSSTGRYYGSFSDNLSMRLASFGFTLLIQRLQFLLLSFPVILLGLYLGAVGVDLGHAERRRELGVMKTRGASRRQVGFLLVLESFLGGLLATVLGIAAGVGLSRLLMGVVTPYAAGAAPDYGEVLLSPETVVTVAILSVLFMGIASYRSAKRTASLPIVETLRYYAPGETRVEYSPTTDVILVGYGIAAYLVTWWGRGMQGNFVLFMLAFVFLVSLPLVPILLIVGSTRLLTRSTGRIYEWTSRASRPFAKDLEYVVSRNLSRNPRRSSNIAIIVALGLAFGIFTVAYLGSQQAFLQRQAWATVGGDLSVGGAYSWNGTEDPTFAANLSRVPGVAEISRIQQVNANTPYTGASVVALDPATYFSVARPESFYFLNPGMDPARNALGTRGTVLITQQYQVSAALQIGDRLTLTSSLYTNGTPASASVTIGGIVRFLPGSTPSSYGYYQGSSMLYGSFETLHDLIAAASSQPGVFVYGGSRYLVSLQPGTDWQTAKQTIAGLGATDVVAYQEILNSTANNPFMTSFLGFIRMEVAFIVVILTAGLGLIIYAASLERDVEFAGIIARGSSGWQTAGLLVGEAFSIMIIGVVIGFAVGIATGYLFASFSAPMTITGVEPVIPMFFEFPLEGVLLLVLAPAAMLGTALLVSWRIAKMNVSQVLKMRGG